MKNNLAQSLVAFWENQHPVVRNSVLLVVTSVVGSLVLAVIAFITPRIFDLAVVFRLAVIEEFWNLAQLVIAAILFYSFVRGLLLVWGNKLALRGFALIALAPVMVLLNIRWTPSFFESTLSYRLDVPYSDLYGEFQALCDYWDRTYGQVENISFRPEELPLGIYDRLEVEVWRENNTIFFDAGDDEKHFGFACVIGQDSTPYDKGRYSRNFNYRQIRGNYYEFYQEDKMQ